MASTLRVQAEHERPVNRIHPLRARRKMAEALEAAMPQFDAQESKARVLTTQLPPLGCIGESELARILLGDKLFLARQYGLYSRTRGAIPSPWR